LWGCETGRCNLSGLITFILYLFILILALSINKVEAGIFSSSKSLYRTDFPGCTSTDYDSCSLFIRSSYENLFGIEGLNLSRLSIFYNPGECFLGCGISSLGYLDLYSELFISFHIACRLYGKRIYMEFNPVFIRQKFASDTGKKKLGLYIGTGLNIGSFEVTLRDRLSGAAYNWHQLSCHMGFELTPCVVSISLWKYSCDIEIETMVLTRIHERFCIATGYRLLSDMILVSTCVKTSTLLFELGTSFHPVLGVSVEVGVGWYLWIKR